MFHWKKRSLVFVLLPLFLLTAVVAPAFAGTLDSEADVSAASIVGDFFVIRPLGFTAMALGTTFFVAAFPVSVVLRNCKQVAQKVVVEPAVFTFSRPLGVLP